MLTSATVAQALHASLTLASGFFPYCAIGFSYGAGTSRNRRRMMLVGVPREIKDSEYRVGLVPSTVHELTLKGHRVLVEKDAGVGAGLADEAYVAAGAEIAANADQIFAEAELIVKVKEPLAPERKKLQPGQVLFKKLCAPCHTVGVGDRVGPDLRGITNRRDQTWLSSFIQSPAKLRARQDPDALALAAEYPAVRMPALGLSQNDAADLVSYLAAETARLADADVPTLPASSQHDHHHHH